MHFFKTICFGSVWGRLLLTGLSGMFTAEEATQIVKDIRWAMAPVALDFVGVAAVSR